MGWEMMPGTDVVVVGAGQAGLGAAKTIADAGPTVVVLEQGQIGETWLSQRWDSFALNTPNWLSALPGAPYEGEDPEGFMTHHELVQYFGQYAKRFDLDVRTGVKVTSLDWLDGGPRYVLSVETEAGKGTFESACVVVASGIARTTRLPGAARGMPADITQISTGGYRCADDLPDGAVLVVGGGQSGAQIVEDLLESGRRTYFSVSTVPRLPRRYRGKDLMHWMLDIGIWDRRADEVEDPAELTATNPLVSGVGPRGHSVSFQFLAKKGATLLGRLEGVDGRVVRTDGKALEYVEQADAVSAEFKKNVDEFIAATGSNSPEAEPDPGDDPLSEADSIEVISEVDLDDTGISTVIWATGFSGEFSWINVPAVDERGRPIHEDGLSEVPGLYFIGFPWLSKRKSGVVLGIEEDASRIADSIVSHLGSR